MGEQTRMLGMELRWRLVCALLAAACSPAFAHSGHTEHQGHSRFPAQIARSSADYVLPKVALVRADGVQVFFPAEIEDGSPILLQFVYTTCAAVCPLMSQIFSEVQAKLGEEPNPLRMVSISIDPEHDTPARLAEYARKIGAGPHWMHYTGSTQASVALQRAFNVYRGDKMNHVPVTFLRVAPGRPWVRLEGLVSPDEVLREYRRLISR